MASPCFIVYPHAGILRLLLSWFPIMSAMIWVKTLQGMRQNCSWVNNILMLNLLQSQSVAPVALPRGICYSAVWLRSQSGQQSAAVAHRLPSTCDWQGWRQQRLVARQNRGYGMENTQWLHMDYIYYSKFGYLCNRLVTFPRSTCRNIRWLAMSFDITTMRYILHPRRSRLPPRPFPKHL